MWGKPLAERNGYYLGEYSIRKAALRARKSDGSVRSCSPILPDVVFASRELLTRREDCGHIGFAQKS
jgi:hypothetical protein